MSISVSKTVVLRELDHDPVAIDGHEARLEHLDDLLASLPAKGQLQSLKVRVNAEGTHYLVTAGNRRLAALRRLRDDGAAVQGVVVTPEFAVHVILSEESDADAYESSRAENLQRLPETPVEEFRAFAKMAKVKPAKEIAAIFGVTEKRVNQRLKLAALHPDVIAALEAGKLTMEAAEAFTLAEPAMQAKYLKGCRDSDWKLQPHMVKTAFTQKLVRGDGKVAEAIGRDAYIAAGGQVLGDAFADGAKAGQGEYWISDELVGRLLAESWEKRQAAWLAEGWSFVEDADSYLKGKGWYVVQDGQLDPDEVSNEVPDDAPLTWSDLKKQYSGVVFWADMSRDPEFGVLRAGTTLPKELQAEKPRSGGYKPPPATLAQPGHDIAEVLDEALTAAFRAKVAADPVLMLRLVIAEMAVGYNAEGSGPLALMREWNLPGEEDSDEEKALTYREHLAALEGKSIDEMLAELTTIVLPGFNFSRYADRGDQAAIALVDPKPTFDAGDYFGRATKTLLEEAFRDMTDPAGKSKPPKGGVEELRKAVRTRAADTGWLPPQLRTPSYTGPCFITKPEADEEEDEQLQAAE